MKKKRKQLTYKKPAGATPLDDIDKIAKMIRAQERTKHQLNKAKKEGWDREHMATVSTRVRAETLAAWTALCSRAGQSRYARLLQLIMDDLAADGLDEMPGYEPKRKTAKDLKTQWWHKTTAD